MLQALEDPRIKQVLSLTANDRGWQDSLARLKEGDLTLTRRTASEAAVEALQRLLVFLGYSIGTGGGFTIDGDFGRGTNRGIAQFQVEHGLPSKASRKTLTYECNGPKSSRANIGAVPEVKLDMTTVDAMLNAALEALDTNQVTFGDFDDALFHLNALHRRKFLDCEAIRRKYAGAASRAVKRVKEETGVQINRKWVLAIIRQESAGVVRPRFEQHHLTKYNKQTPRADLGELRLRSMSMGLGQIMGSNHTAIGAASPRMMLVSRADDQVLFVARFLAKARNKSALAADEPSAQDYIDIARYYNGKGYAQNRYDEKLETKFLEFSRLMA